MNILNTLTRNIKILTSAAAAGMLLMLGAQTLIAQPVRADIADNICQGVLSTESGAVNEGATIDQCQEDINSDRSFGGIAKRIINIFSIVVGAVSVIMIIIGGFRYIISGGDSAGVTGAKNTILYAIVGLVIVLFAQIIIRFVLTNVTPS